MGEIKSTLDLIMEKTRHLSLKEEEKVAMKKDELIRKVQGVVFGFLNGEKKATVLSREIEALPSEQHQEAQRISLDLLLEGLSPFEDNTRILSGVEALQDDVTRKEWETVIYEIRPSFEERDEEIRKIAEDRAREDLAARGLKGPALFPNPEASSFCRKERKELLSAFRTLLRERLGSPPHR